MSKNKRQKNRISKSFSGTTTVYTRMLISFVSIVLVSMCVLGLLLGYVFKEQFEQDRRTEMLNENDNINQIMEEKYWPKDKRDIAFEELAIIARKYNALIRVVDRNGEITVTDPERGNEWQVENSEQSESTKLAQEEFFVEILNGKSVYTKSFFGEYLGTPVMTVGRPLVIQNDIEGAIFMHRKMDDIDQAINRIYHNVFLASGIAVFLAVLLTAYMSRQFTKPLVQMSKLAKLYAKGEFNERINVNSDDEIGELAESLNKMASELHSLETMRKTFVANVSHELKSPLASMRGFLTAVLDGSIAKDDHEEYLGIVLDETKRLSGMINDLLDLSKIESGKFPLHKTIFDVNEHIRRILITFETRIDDKELDVDVNFGEDYLIVEADSDKISQVISNLIDNAIKFSNNKGTLYLSAKKENNKVYIEIADNGIGIPEEDVPFIFGRFYKVEKAHTPGSEGTGLGLSIAKRIINQHGMEISCQSKLGMGTKFIFCLKASSLKVASGKE